MARILVVDDDTQIREMLQEMLQGAGYEAVAAPDGKVAMKLFREEPAELVITDLIMPDKGGLETIMELRRDFSEVKIIAISGVGRVEPNQYLDLADKLGAHRTLTKPFRCEEFLTAVHELLE